jgi:hypothetical protein
MEFITMMLSHSFCNGNKFSTKKSWLPNANQPNNTKKLIVVLGHDVTVSNQADPHNCKDKDDFGKTVNNKLFYKCHKRLQTI